jgi:exonuclease III
VTGETLLYSGTTGDGAPHENGVALMLSKQAAKSLVEWEPVSERIVKARFEAKFQKSTIIQTYAPTTSRIAVLDKTKRRDITLVMGDLNANK